MTAPEPKKRGPKSVTAEHKAAMASGRNEGRSVRLYLEALSANRPKRGRKRTAESVAKRLDAITGEMPTADALSRVLLTQERMDLQAELESMADGVDMAAIEAEFIAAAGAYSERKGISHAAWRAAGVDPVVLAKAGITR
jgi:uncharacterized protein YicC (UPF0701 family)